MVAPQSAGKDRRVTVCTRVCTEEQVTKEVRSGTVAALAHRYDLMVGLEAGRGSDEM